MRAPYKVAGCFILCLATSLPAMAKKPSRNEVLALHGIDGKTELDFINETRIEDHLFSHTLAINQGRFLIQVSGIDRLRHVDKHMKDLRNYDLSQACQQYMEDKRAELEYPIKEHIVVGSNLNYRPVFLKEDGLVYLLGRCFHMRVKDPK